jgi:hypothetical protein
MAAGLFSTRFEDGWATDLSVAHFLVPLQASAIGQMKALAPNPASAVDGGIPLQPNPKRRCPAATDPHC